MTTAENLCKDITFIHLCSIFFCFVSNMYFLQDFSRVGFIIPVIYF